MWGLGSEYDITASDVGLSFREALADAHGL
jgi:hypothetical protein